MLDREKERMDEERDRGESGRVRKNIRTSAKYRETNRARGRVGGQKTLGKSLLVRRTERAKSEHAGKRVSHHRVEKDG